MSTRNTNIAKSKLGRARLPFETASVGNGYAASGPVKTYHMSREEIIKRYGPPKAEKKPFVLNMRQKKKGEEKAVFEREAKIVQAVNENAESVNENAISCNENAISCNENAISCNENADLVNAEPGGYRIRSQPAGSLRNPRQPWSWQERNSQKRNTCAASRPATATLKSTRG